MAKGNLEVSLPEPYLGGGISAEVFEEGGVKPAFIIRTDQEWGVKVRWQLKGSLAEFICGDWCVHLRMESMGPGHELKFTPSKRIPLNPCGNGEYEFTFRIKPGQIKDAHCSIPYKPVVTVTYYTACDRPGPMAGFVELPILQFYPVGGKVKNGGNGSHEAHDIEARLEAEVEAEGEEELAL